jgi:hypothetical protein
MQITLLVNNVSVFLITSLQGKLLANCPGITSYKRANLYFIRLNYKLAITRSRDSLLLAINYNNLKQL